MIVVTISSLGNWTVRWRIRSLTRRASGLLSISRRLTGSVSSITMLFSLASATLGTIGFAPLPAEPHGFLVSGVVGERATDFFPPRLVGVCSVFEARFQTRYFGFQCGHAFF